MTTLPTFTKIEIRDSAGDSVYQRGVDYFEDGMVAELVQRGNVLHAEVQGSAPDPYHVTVQFTATGIADVDCTCPYGGWCKHVVATLLTALQDPQTIETRATIQAMLENLTRDQLYALLIDLTAQVPALAENIDAWVAQRQLVASLPAATLPTGAAPTGNLSSSSPTAPSAPLDAKTIRQQMRKALKGVSKIETAARLLSQVQTMIEAGDVTNAHIMLDGLTDEFVSALPASNDYYDDYDDEGGDDGSFDQLAEFNELWADLILNTNFSKKEGQGIAEKLEAWDETIEERNGDTVFGTARLAVTYGWDYPPLQRAMQGEITERGAWEGEAPYEADALALIRLRILARQGRTQEYLNLAQAEGKFTLYLLKLVEIGRAEEATKEALDHLTAVDDLLQLAQALHSQGATAQAIQIAKHGLAQEKGSKRQLAKWLHDLYLARGDTADALPLLMTMLLEQPSLAEYRRLQQLAGSDWSQIRQQTLDALRQITSYYISAEARAEIFLSEELWDDAIAIANTPYATGALIPVMDKVAAHRPEWVIQKAKQHAESIMDAGKADHYQEAIQWLQRVKRTYQATGRAADWKQYFHLQRAKHQRKYKLVGLMNQL